MNIEEKTMKDMYETVYGLPSSIPLERMRELADAHLDVMIDMVRGNHE